MPTNNTRGLWRGKRVDNGEWVKGDLSRMGEQRFIAGKDHWKFAVDPSTLGECTGLTDKNGNLIFEGDIIRGIINDSERLGVIVWIYELATFGLRYLCRKNQTAWQNATILTSMRCYENGQRDTEIIGNIHDTPELLKGADKP